MKQIEWEKLARRQMEDLARRQPNDARRLVDGLHRFAREGTGDLKKLQDDGGQLWRLRIGDWRVMFRFMPGGDLLVVRVVNRRDAYE